LTHEPFFPLSGGGSAEALYLVDEFVRRGFQVHVFCPKLADLSQAQHRFAVTFHEFSRWEMGRYTKLRNVKYVFYPFALERLVMSQIQTGGTFDLIFSQHAISAVTAGRLKKRLGVPVVMNFLDHLTGFMDAWPSYVAPKPLVGALKRFELSLPARYDAEAVLTVSDALAALFIKNGCPRDRLTPIYFGYDSGIFQLRKAVPQPSDESLVVMHGSFDTHHLGKIAIEALQTVFAARPRTRFRFVGHRTAAVERLFNQAQARMPGIRMECTGFVAYENVAAMLTEASVGMVPYERTIGTDCAFVAKPVEYAALGIPIVCTPLASVKSFFGQTPLVRFSEFDGTDFGRTILGWLNESPETIAQWGAEASQRVKATLDWRSISQRAADVVEKVLESSGTVKA
jgi:glycosyltransferase involved in cell wall biosynthesis